MESYGGCGALAETGDAVMRCAEMSYGGCGALAETGDAMMRCAEM